MSENSQFKENMRFELEDLKLQIGCIEREIEQDFENIDLYYLIFKLSHINEYVSNTTRLIKEASNIKHQTIN